MIKLKDLLLEYMNDQKIKILRHLIDSAKGRVEYNGKHYSVIGTQHPKQFRLSSSAGSILLPIAYITDYETVYDNGQHVKITTSGREQVKLAAHKKVE